MNNDNKENVFIPEIGVAEVSEYYPSEEEKKLIIKFEEQAEKDIESSHARMI